MEKVDIRSIVKITDKKIVYRNASGETAFVELPLCADRYEEEHDRPKDAADLRCVGERFFGACAYYQFYASPPIRFSLEMKTNPLKRFLTKVFGWNFHNKEFQRFYLVQKRLQSCGWTTLDLS